jgi:allantoinase
MLIKNGLLALPGEDDFIRGDIRIEEGVISEIGDDLRIDEEIYDAEGEYIFPGVIDAHVHFDDPGYTHREDFRHGTMAAASGGVTTVIDMPCTSIPPVTDKSNFFKKLEAIAPSAVIDYGLYGGVSGDSFAAAMEGELKKLSDYILGVKTYFVSGMKTFPAIDPDMLEEVLTETKKLGLPVLLHAEDPAVIEEKKKMIPALPDEFYSYYLSRPEEAETEAVKKAVERANKSEGNLHIVHVGTANAVKIINSSRFVTCETAPHYLAFSAEDLNSAGAPLKTTPPVKSRKNKNDLWKYLSFGDINFVASDHAPAPRKEKFTTSVWTAYSGIPGSGTMFPFLLSEGLFSGKLSLSRFIHIISAGPAMKYGIDKFKGALEIGKDGDLVVVNPNENHTVVGDRLYSKGTITPFEGKTFFGKVKKTMVRGKWVFDSEKGIVGKSGYGKIVTRYERVNPGMLH